MTEVGLAMPGSSMDDGRHFYPSHGSYMDNYVLPGPSVYPPVYEPNTPPPSTYPAMGGLHSTSSEEWAGQEMSLSPGEREKAKNRRREQNRASQRAYRKRKGMSSRKLPHVVIATDKKQRIMSKDSMKVSKIFEGNLKYSGQRTAI